MVKMMSRSGMIILEIAVLTLSSTIAWGTTYTVSSSYSSYDYSYSFSPATVTITLGDTVIFSLNSAHNAMEVSQATWNADGNTSDGGFDTPFGGGLVIPSHTGTYYYVCGIHYSMGMKGSITVSAPTGVIDPHQSVPHEFSLHQNFPNPFNPTTSISYALPVESRVMVRVFNVQGEVVATLVNEVQAAGNQSVIWNANALASGIYIYRLEATGVGNASKTLTQVRKMVLLK